MATGSVSAPESGEWLLVVPGYSKLAADSGFALVKTFYFRRHLWLVRVSSFSFVKDGPTYLFVSVGTDKKKPDSGTTISIEILNDTYEHTVFHSEHTIKEGFLLVARSDLDAASCVHEDNIHVMCTLTFLDIKKRCKPERSKFKYYSPLAPPMESGRWLFAIPGYSKLGLMPSNSRHILVKTLYFRRHLWCVEVKSCIFVNDEPTTLSINVFTDIEHLASGTTISIEILNDTWEHVVFHTERTLDDDTWLEVLFVKMSELEVASCVHNDNIPVRCTLTFRDTKKQGRMEKEQQQLAKTSSFKSWNQLTSGLSDRSEISMESKPMIGDKRMTLRSYSPASPTESDTWLFPIPCYSKLGLLTSGSPPILVKTFYFRRHLWRVEVCPLRFIKGVPTYICVLVSTDIKSSALGTTVSIEILNDTWEHTMFRDEHTLDEDSWRHAFLAVKRSDLETAPCVHDDCIPIKCTLTCIPIKRTLTFLDVEEQGMVEKEQQRHTATSNFKSWYRRLRKIILPDPKSNNGIKKSSSFESDSNLTPLLGAKYGCSDYTFSY